MPIIPVRGLSEHGIISDVDPYTLPATAWSFGVNVRFRNGSILRAPVFRTADTLTDDDPRFLYSTTPSSGFDKLIIGYLDGRLYLWDSGTETNVSISGYMDSDAETPFTSISLADVIYVNREDRVPWYLGPSDTEFSELTDWDAGWRAKLLRQCGGALVALGITKSGTSYPTMVKTSEFPLAGTVPADWDETDPTSNATENILSKMEGAIVDALNLGTPLYIYGREETWIMQPDGSENVFSYDIVFSDTGAINANCVVEAEKKHFVFGLNDIWVHDGVSKDSICNKRTRDFIFGGINVSEAGRCFAVHNKALKEIYFCYVSGDRGVTFTDGTGCNRAAVYNYVDNNWSFYDLPFIHFADEANLDATDTYASSGGTYAGSGGSYLDQEDSFKKTMVMAGDVSATHSITKSLYAFDLEGPGSAVALPIDTNATLGWQLEREGIDLDEVGADLTGYKCIDSIIPQGRLAPGAEPIEFCFGSSDYFNVPVEYTDWQTWDGDTLYKLDYRAAGRYLSMRVRHQDTTYASLTALDMDIDIIGKR